MNRRTALVAFCTLVVAGCASAPPQPTSSRDPQANFAAYKSYDWAPPPGGNDQPLLLLDRNIRAAIDAELQRRGYSPVLAGATPDLRIAYETASAQKIESNPVRVGIGMGSWGGNVGGSINVGSPSVRNYKEGTLVIHAIDAARNAEVWEGRVSSRLTQGSTEAAAIRQAVAAAMKDFPSR